ncbi:hypothetical protein HHI36_004329 [Cryptolaemus montrouzieri]
MEYLQRQKTVEKMVNDLTNYESVLERTGKTLKAQLAERDSLVVQWKETVKILNQRDTNISILQDKLLETVEVMQKDEEIKKNEENLLNIERNNNKEIERESEDLNAQYSRYLRDLDKVVQSVMFLNTEANSMKRQVTKTANDLETERCRQKTLRKEIENKHNEIENVEKKIDKMKEKYESLKVANMSVAERCKHLERLIDYESKQHHVFLSDSDRLSQALFRAQSKLSEQIEITGNRELDIANLVSLVDGLQKMTKEAQNTVDNRKEMIYNMEFRIDQLEEKLALIEKQKNSEDDEEQFLKIKELEKTCADHTETRTLLQDQISRIQDEMRRLTTSITNDEEKLQTLQNKLQNEKLDYEGGLKQVATAKSAAQEKQVEENILILRLKQFQQSMKKEENEIYTLQKMKLNLEQAMRERDLEVKSKRELLYVQKRNLDEDRGRLKCDMKSRQIKVDQLQSKYHLVTMSLGTDEEGQTLSVTHYKLQAAQDKYFLKQRGDFLDNKIKTIECEIVAMENTLKVVNLTNAAYKKSLSEVEDTDKEAHTMASLQKKYVDVTDQLREFKIKLASDKQELKDLNKEMCDLKDQKKEMEDSVENLVIELNKLQKELEDKQEKVTRTDNLIKKVEKKIDAQIMAKYDRDLEIQHLAEINKNGLQKLCQIAEYYREIKPSLVSLAREYGIKLPDSRTLPLRLSETSLTSSDIISSLSSDLRSFSSRTESKTSAKETTEGKESRGSCQCSNSSSVSIASVVLSFDGKGKK